MGWTRPRRLDEMRLRGREGLWFELAFRRALLADYNRLLATGISAGMFSTFGRELSMNRSID